MDKSNIDALIRQFPFLLSVLMCDLRRIQFYTTASLSAIILARAQEVITQPMHYAAIDVFVSTMQKASGNEETANEYRGK